MKITDRVQASIYRALKELGLDQGRVRSYTLTINSENALKYAAELFPLALEHDQLNLLHAEFKRCGHEFVVDDAVPSNMAVWAFPN